MCTTNFTQFLPVLITVLGLAISVLLVRSKLIQSGRLAYTGSLLSDKSTLDDYKSLLMDLRFTQYAFEVFPTLDVNSSSTLDAIRNRRKRALLSTMLSFMRDAFGGIVDYNDPSLNSGNRYLRDHYPDLYAVAKDSHLLEDVFVDPHFEEIEKFIADISAALSFRFTRGGFLALISPSPKTMRLLEDFLSEFCDWTIYEPPITEETSKKLREVAGKAEKELCAFVLGNWPRAPIWNLLRR